MKLRTRDVAICANISPYVVREYIDAGLLGPIELSENNYRWIDPRAIPQACIWRTLQEAGLSMEQLREFGRNRTPEKALGMFRNYSDLLDLEITRLRRRQDMLSSYAALIQEGQFVKPGEISVRALAKKPIHRVPLKQAKGEADAYKHLRDCILQLPNGGSPLGYAYNDFQELLERPGQPAQLVSFDPKGAELRPAGEYLIGTTVRDDETPADLSRRMLRYAMKSGLAFRGPAYIVCPHDAISVDKQEHYLLQISVMVTQIVEGT